MHRIAIVGIGGLFPGAGDTEDRTQSGSHLETFWKNIQTGRDCSREVPEDRWLLNKDDALNENKSAELAADKVKSVRGCLLGSMELEHTGLDIQKDIWAQLHTGVVIL